MDQKNLILAIVLSVIILLGFQLFFAPPPPEPGSQTVSETPTQAPDAGGVPQVPGANQGQGQALSPSLSRDDVVAESPRIRIDTPQLEGSIALLGGRIDDLILKSYRETLNPESDRIVLLSPSGSERPYFADFGWSAADRSLVLPNSQTLWQADYQELRPDQPVTLSWNNGEGLTFQRRYELDENYMFNVTQTVVNRSGAAVDLSPYGLISRSGTPNVLGFYILHEGLLGVFSEDGENSALKEVDYDDLQDDGVIAQDSVGGWIGITDKYWLVALVPDQSKTSKSRFVHSAKDGLDKYQTDFLQAPISIASGSSAENSSHLFAGAKKVLLLDRYKDDLGIARFDLAVDFGWFFYLTKPMFYALHWLAEQTGNFGVAILLLTVAVKIAFFPLANKSYRSMAKMRKLQPKMLELREQYGDDKQRLNQEMMELYKKEGANPMSGCLPILVQIPVFFALYKVLFVNIEMRQAPFFGWVQDLSAPDPTSILNIFGLLPWDVPELGVLNVISLGVWPILMGITMFLQQQLNPQPTDPMQAKIFLFMPIIFTFLLAQFPAGLVIYWTWNNTLSIIQQAVIMKRAGVPIGRQPKSTST